MEKINIRQCIVTKKRYKKEDLFKVVSFRNKVQFDKDQKLMGKGAYLSKNSDIILKAKKKKLLNKAFKTEVADEIYDQILEVMNAS